MNLADMLKNDWFASVATATVATPATHEHKTTPTVAKVATVAVANPTKLNIGRGAANDAERPDPVNAEVVNNLVNKVSPDWHALDKAYQAHHVTCPACIAAGRVDGQRCGTGAALWAAYDQTHKPASTRAQPAPAPTPAPKPTAGIHPSLMTAATPDEIKRMVQRLALFASRGLSEGEADRLTDKLLVRDRDIDSRGVCAECVNLRGYGPGRWKCGDNRTTNELAGAWVGAAFVHLNLHRCHSLRGAI